MQNHLESLLPCPALQHKFKKNCMTFFSLLSPPTIYSSLGQFAVHLDSVTIQNSIGAGVPVQTDQHECVGELGSLLNGQLVLQTQYFNSCTLKKNILTYCSLQMSNDQVSYDQTRPKSIVNHAGNMYSQILSSNNVK